MSASVVAALTLPGAELTGSKPFAVPKDHTIVSITELQAKLGKPGWRVWEALRSRCNPADGRTHVSLKGIARHPQLAPITTRLARKGLVRLRQAGLVQDVGWKCARVPFGKRSITARILFRDVRGFLAYAGKTPVAVVPEQTGQWVAGASAHGGARAGAGRPRKSGSR